MDIKKEILNKFGLCENCGCPLNFNFVHKMTGQFNSSKEKYICPTCKTNEILNKFKQKEVVKNEKVDS